MPGVSCPLHSYPPTATQTPGSLLKQISSLREGENEGSPTVRLTSDPAEHQKKNLIQVISSTVTARPQKPEYQLSVNSDPEGISRSVELTVELPKVSAMSECQLRISQVSGCTFIDIFEMSFAESAHIVLLEFSGQAYTVLNAVILTVCRMYFSVG